MRDRQGRARQLGQARATAGARDKGARDKGARDKGARDKGAQDKGAQDKGAQDKSARDKSARDKGVRLEARQEKPKVVRATGRTWQETCIGWQHTSRHAMMYETLCVVW